MGSTSYVPISNPSEVSVKFSGWSISFFNGSKLFRGGAEGWNETKGPRLGGIQGGWVICFCESSYVFFYAFHMIFTWISMICLFVGSLICLFLLPLNRLVETLVLHRVSFSNLPHWDILNDELNCSKDPNVGPSTSNSSQGTLIFKWITTPWN